MPADRLPITVIIAARNEEDNLPNCLASVKKVTRVIVVDSHSTDHSRRIVEEHGHEFVNFDYKGGYPKKRQWALDQMGIETDWVMFLDADEQIPEVLWQEIEVALQADVNGYFVVKGFHFLGRKFRYGGFSHPAIILFRTGTGRFERLDELDNGGLDMEIHERLIVEGDCASLEIPLIHKDEHGLASYLSRHNQYSTWEAGIRYRFMQTGRWGEDAIRPRLFGDSQQRRRFIKRFIMQLPFEPQLWFFYHYVWRLGFLEGMPGYIASKIRAQYIRDARFKIWEIRNVSE